MKLNPDCMFNVMTFLGKHSKDLVHVKFFEDLFKCCDSLPIKTRQYAFKFADSCVIFDCDVYKLDDKSWELLEQFEESFKDKMKVICKKF